MVTSPSQIQLIRDKRRALDDEMAKIEGAIAKLDEKLVMLREQAKDFETAERVLLSLSGDDDRAQEIASESEGTGKPQGIPTTPDMIIRALDDAGSRGKPGLQPHEILTFIKSKWWPQATNHDVSPVVWRMAKDGRLSKDQMGNYGLSRHDSTLRRRLKAFAESDDNAA